MPQVKKPQRVIVKDPNQKPKTNDEIADDLAKRVELPEEEVKEKGKTCYHVSKRDNDGREWKVFIQGSKKVIKLFSTQKEALDYAKQLCKNKNDGSYVMLHGLDGKIRKY